MSARGTVDFEYKGKKLFLRGDIEAMDEIEDFLNDTMLGLGIYLSQGKGLKLKQKAALIWGGLRGYYRSKNAIEDAPSFEEVREYIYEKGIMEQDVLMACSKFIRFSSATEDEIEAAEKLPGKKITDFQETQS